MASRKYAGIIIPWGFSLFLFFTILTDGNHGFISILETLSPVAPDIVSGIAFFLAGFPFQDPYLRIIASKMKPEISLRNRLLNLEVNAETIMKLETEIKTEEIKLPQHDKDERKRMKAGILIKLNQISIALDHVDDDLEHVKRDFIDFRKFVKDTTRRNNNGSL